MLFTSQWSHQEGMELADALGPNVRCLRAQVSTRSNASLVEQWVRRHTDELDLIVCSASTVKRIALGETTPDDSAGLLESNLLGPYFRVQQCLPMLQSVSGCVVNIADAQATAGVPYFSAYTAAKAGLISLTQSLAVGLAPKVRVNAVLPGMLEWPVDRSTYTAEDRTATVAMTPLQRIGEWADVVEAVDFLAGARFVTGTCLPINGGRSTVA